MRAREPASFWWENEIDGFQRECCTRDSNKSSNARNYTIQYKKPRLQALFLVEKKITMKLSGVPTLACVASVSSRGSSRKLGQEQKKKMNDGGGGGERRNLFSPPPPTFFASALPFAQ